MPSILPLKVKGQGHYSTYSTHRPQLRHIIVVIIAAGDPTYMAVHCSAFPVAGTVYRPTSPQLQLGVFIRTASKLTSFSQSFPSFLFLVSSSVHRVQ